MVIIHIVHLGCQPNPLDWVTRLLKLQSGAATSFAVGVVDSPHCRDEGR